MTSWPIGARCLSALPTTPPELAVGSIDKWWRQEGRKRYAPVNDLAILADAGGSNAPTCRAWGHELQRQLCERHGLTLTVAHYPSGASKWNPIEHRLFSQISESWAGRPLDSYSTVVAPSTSLSR